MHIIRGSCLMFSIRFTAVDKMSESINLAVWLALPTLNLKIGGWSSHKTRLTGASLHMFLHNHFPINQYH